MTKKLLLTLYICVAFLCSGMAQTRLSFSLEGLCGTHQIQLTPITGQDEKPLCTIAVADGKGTGEMQLDDPRGFSLSIDDLWTGKLIVLGPDERATLGGIVQVTGEEGNMYYDLEQTTLTGSSMNDEFMRRNLDKKALNRLHEQIYSNPAFVAYRQAWMAKDSARMAEIRATDDFQRFEREDKAFLHTVDSTYRACFAASHDSWFGPFLMLVNYSHISQQQGDIFELFTEEALNSYYGHIVHDLIYPPTMVGVQMPDFTFTDHNTGREQTLYTLLKERKLVLLDFWASWCRPCRNEIPNLKANYTEFHEKGFDIVSISADAHEADWLKALDEEDLPWFNDIDGQKGIASLYKVKYYPTLYLLDHEGKVVAKDIRGERLGRVLNELLNQ